MARKLWHNLAAIAVVAAAVGAAALLRSRPGGSEPPAAATETPRLVDVGSDKCEACKELAPILEALRTKYAGRLRVEFVDVFQDPSAEATYGVRVIPTQVLFDKGGREVWRHEGFISEEDLEAVFADKTGVR